VKQNLAGTILEEILAVRRRRVQEAHARTPLSLLRRQAALRRDYRSFPSALAGPGVRIIAEMKKASPSAGLIRANYSCGEIAKAYQHAGAVSLSVLTEEDYFRGSLSDLMEARSATCLPVLRKDFIVDEYQVYEAVAAGADALLLIVAALPELLLRSLVELAGQLQIAALVEVHTEEELQQAVAAGASIIGVNNRDLHTLEVDLATSLRLREKIPSHCRSVSESGIRSAAEVKMLLDAGFDSMLVGESFMRSEKPGDALKLMVDEANKLLYPRPFCETQ
jgi:indole-3-glycerol phosphate synthase